MRYLGDIQKLPLAPGDVLVLTVDDHVDANLATKIRESMQGYFPGHTVIVLERGMKLGAIADETRSITAA